PRTHGVGRKQDKAAIAQTYGGSLDRDGRHVSDAAASGRWPANVVLDEEAGRMLDSEVGEVARGHFPGKGKVGPLYKGGWGERTQEESYTDAGGPSRFFYCAKASREEREAGLSGIAARYMDDTREPEKPGGMNPRNRGGQERRANFHPTVKPIALMRWLVRLVTPPGGIVLDPFLGSGTTLLACSLERFNGFGIEKSPEYEPIIKGRISTLRNTLVGFENEQ
ncbi:MAG TPA: site-specific DNA-methyltransferase, partial [Thermoplasmata archaeon]|nr:site-specific DNA-methyltransferase [Thermoplasmata archaeon]